MNGAGKVKATDQLSIAMSQPSRPSNEEEEEEETYCNDDGDGMRRRIAETVAARRKEDELARKKEKLITNYLVQQKRVRAEPASMRWNLCQHS